MATDQKVEHNLALKVMRLTRPSLAPASNVTAFTARTETAEIRRVLFLKVEISIRGSPLVSFYPRVLGKARQQILPKFYAAPSTFAISSGKARCSPSKY